MTGDATMVNCGVTMVNCDVTIATGDVNLVTMVTVPVYKDV